MKNDDNLPDLEIVDPNEEFDVFARQALRVTGASVAVALLATLIIPSWRSAEGLSNSLFFAAFINAGIIYLLMPRPSSKQSFVERRMQSVTTYFRHYMVLSVALVSLIAVSFVIGLLVPS